VETVRLRDSCGRNPGGKFGRRQTGKSGWDEAKAVAASWEQTGVWEGKTKPAPPSAPVVPREPSDQRVTIERAIKVFLDDISKYSASKTLDKYRHLLAKLKRFSDHRGYVMIEQWTPLDVREMRASWEVSPQSAAKDMSTIKAFFEFCVANEWITRNPAHW